ncbi:hypothetical protein CEUSTIGMA_g5511.t1 [Chlamydomonas eustigma]|uniref:Xanthine/uracil permease n=1 Tax=Chlamydomonas eustigma TaxID=1157962 RepID=A0A250X575_9CHLO|nr:hypothetical protein CEUSTIGMA_g5511.t1 [Chlamydomonas eustigma]|eukprot:GAX78069.1 hypothetical protein CEUSTIGMA_g5511.t1 [Chlamydomonas eustigma]
MSEISVSQLPVFEFQEFHETSSDSTGDANRDRPGETSQRSRIWIAIDNVLDNTQPFARTDCFAYPTTGTSTTNFEGVELRAGLSTFLTISFILVLNPQILSVAGLPITQTTGSTAMCIAVASCLSGVFSNLPFVLGPSGLNVHLVYSEVLGNGIPIPVALACCLIASIIVAALTLARAVSFVIKLVPSTIKLAIVVGMGLLLSLIGMQTAGVVVPNKNTMLGLGSLLSVDVGVAAGGLMLIATLHHHKVRGSFLIGMTYTTLAAFIAVGDWPTRFLALPSVQMFGLDFSTATHGVSILTIITYVLIMVCDIGGSIYGEVDTYTFPPGHVDSEIVKGCLGSILGALTGITPLIITAESSVGNKEGGRTGLVPFTVGVCFLASLFLWPLLQAIPLVTTAPVLVLVGALMMGESGNINWTRMTSAVPAFLTIVMQPFTFSIANGVYAGLASSLVLFFLSGDFIQPCKKLYKRHWPYQVSVLEQIPGPSTRSSSMQEEVLDAPAELSLNPHPALSKQLSAAVSFKRKASLMESLQDIELPHDRPPASALELQELLISTTPGPSLPATPFARHAHLTD